VHDWLRATPEDPCIQQNVCAAWTKRQHAPVQPPESNSRANLDNETWLVTSLGQHAEVGAEASPGVTRGSPCNRLHSRHPFAHPCACTSRRRGQRTSMRTPAPASLSCSEAQPGPAAQGTEVVVSARLPWAGLPETCAIDTLPAVAEPSSPAPSATATGTAGAARPAPLALRGLPRHRQPEVLGIELTILGAPANVPPCRTDESSAIHSFVGIEARADNTNHLRTAGTRRDYVSRACSKDVDAGCSHGAGTANSPSKELHVQQAGDHGSMH
jgi:hypothetical protein